MRIVPNQIEQQIKEAGDRKGGLQDKRVARREGLRSAFVDPKNGKQVGPFRRGDRLRPEMSMAPALGDWSPEGQYRLKELVPINLQQKLDQSLKHAGVMCQMETVDGVRELIEYDLNEQEVIQALEAGKAGPADLSLPGSDPEVKGE